MLIFDSFTNSSQHNFQQLRKEIPSSKESFPLSTLGTTDWLLQTILQESLMHDTSPATQHIQANPLCHKLQKNEILKDMNDFSVFCKRYIHKLREMQTFQNLEFLENIEKHLKSYLFLPLLQQEVQEAQIFLQEQMEQILFKFHKENAHSLKEAMQKYSTNHANNNDNNNFNASFLEIQDLKILKILAEYGIHSESKELETLLVRYLSTIPKTLKDSTKNEEIETKHLQAIEENINTFRIQQMELAGFHFFTSLPENLLPKNQEAIADSIAKVLSFYAQPNTLEKGGYKISWQPTTPKIQDYHTHYPIPLMLQNAKSAEIRIEFQVLIIFPTLFSNPPSK